MGSAPNVAATAHVTHPVKQGLIQTLGVFTDTLIICTCTAFIILFSGAPLDGSTNGVQLTQQALTNEIGSAGSIFVAIALFFFAFSSILGNYYYGEANVRYLTRKKWILNIYRILVGGMVLFGALAALDVAWSLADVTMGLMALCNLIAISLLGKYAFKLLEDYRAQKRVGIKDPVFTKDRLKEVENDIECWIAANLGITNIRFVPDVANFKRLFKIPTQGGRLGQAEKTASRKMLMQDYGLSENFFKEIDASVKKHCRTQNDVQAYLFMYQGFSQDLMMLMGNLMQWKFRVPSVFKGALRTMTEKTVHDVCTKTVWKKDDVHKTAMAVRQYKERLGYSEQWMTEYVYNVVLLAKKEPKNKATEEK